MKKAIQKLTAIIITVFMLFSIIPLNGLIQAEAATTDGGKVSDTISWSYNDGTLIISGSGEMPNYKTVNYYYEGIVSDTPWRDYLGSITSVSISGTITNIGDCAFSDCPLLNTISMPSTINVIGNESFARCEKLESIVFPSSLIEIGQSAFIGCSSIEELSIPNTVTTVRSGAFQSCSNLKTVKLSSSLTSIAGSLFRHCSRLNSIILPPTVTEINTWAFNNCSALKDINIPSSVTKIYSEAFYSCKSLTELNIPESVTHIHNRAFQYCSGLKKVTVNNKETYFFTDVFKNCGSLIVYGYSDSTAEKYCEENGYAFSALDADSSELRIKTFEIDKESGQKIGAQITLSAKATGGSSPYQYLFYIKDTDGNEKTISGYSNSNSTTFTLTDVGIFTFGVRVKDNTDKTIDKQTNNYNIVGFTGFSGGNGSENDPYIISDIPMFLEIKNNINANYKLANNIDLSSFERISEFNGTLDGAGHTINISLSEKNGIFNTVKEKGIVRNLNVNIGKVSDFLPVNFGSVCLKNYGQIIKCSFTGSISSPSNIMFKLNSFGGIAAENSGIINKCKNKASISINKSATSAGYRFGGICGTNNYNGIIEYCLVDGYQRVIFQPLPSQYYGSSYYNSFIGGVCGYSSGEYNNNIKNCAINTSLRFGNVSEGDYGYSFSYGLISGDEYHTTSNGLKLAEKLNGVKGCIANSTDSLTVDYQFYGTGGGLNDYSEVYNYSDMKNIAIKSSSEITEWWNSLIKDDEPPTPDISKYEFSLSGNKYYLLNKESTLNVGYRSAVDGQVLNELKNIKWTNSNPSIATVSGLDTGIADYDKNNVTVMATVKANNVGSTIIEGTSPDGRKASFTINVEPEIMAISSLSISKTKEIETFIISVNNPDDNYLASFVNSLDIQMNNNPVGSFSITNKRISIEESKKKAKITYTFEPQKIGGSVTVIASSPTGQKATAIINNSISAWDYQNEWNFKNYSVNSISLTDDDYFALIENCSAEDIAAWNRIINKEHGGQCYGMAVSSVLAKKEILSLDDIQNNSNSLYSISRNALSESVIGYYYLLQCTPEIQQYQTDFGKMSKKQQISKVLDCDLGVFLFSFKTYNSKESNPDKRTESHGHAIVINGKESGNWTINDKTYNIRMLTYDSNYPKNKNSRENSYIYINTQTNEWLIPNYSDPNLDFSKNSSIDGVLIDENLLNVSDLSLEREKGKAWIRTKQQGYRIIGPDGSAVDVRGPVVNNPSFSAHMDYSYNPDNNDRTINIELNDYSNYRLLPLDDDYLDFSFSCSDFFLSSESYKCEEIRLSDGKISLFGLEGEHEIELTVDKNNSKYSTYVLSGNNTTDISLEMTDNGLSIEGDDLSDIIITGKNQTDDESESISIANGDNSVQIINQNETFDLSGNTKTGDVDFDGTVDITDATFIQRQLVSIPIPFVFDHIVADVDGDGLVTIMDATFIQKYLSNLTDHFCQPEKVALNATEKALNVGDKFSLIPTVTPADATNKSITWSSSDSSIATVSNGVVTALASGTATITAKAYNWKAAKCTVIVKSNIVNPTSVTLKADASTLTVGFTTRLLPIVYPSNATDKSVSFSNSDESVVSITTDGEGRYWLKGKASGKATITATTSNGKTATFTINVVNPQPTSIRPDYGTYYLSVGESTTIKPLLEPYNAQTTISWKSSDDSIARVDSSGNVTAFSEGSITISLSTENGKSGSCIVYVNKIKIGDFYTWIDNNLKVLNSMYSQDQGRILGEDDLEFIYPFNDGGTYTEDYDATKNRNFNVKYTIIKNNYTVNQNNNTIANFCSYESNRRILDDVAYNSVVAKQVNAFYDTCKANYYYLLFASGDNEFADFGELYAQFVENERNNQRLALDEMVSYLYDSDVYGNKENQIYKGLISKINNVKTKSDAAELLAYFEKNFRK